MSNIKLQRPDPWASPELTHWADWQARLARGEVIPKRLGERPTSRVKEELEKRLKEAPAAEFE